MAAASTELERSTTLAQQYRDVRTATRALASRLSAEDSCIQSMPDASPTKWHLAHTSWFFETFVLGPHAPSYRPFCPEYAVLFNSYYQGIGPQHPRPQRGLLSRPSLEDVSAYRAHVDDAVLRWLETSPPPELLGLVVLGLHHEQQHQELLLTDAHHALFTNPLRPAYLPPQGEVRRDARPTDDDRAPPSDEGTRGFRAYPGGIVEIGYSGEGFAFDNERPRHRVLLEPFELSRRLVTVGEYLAFMEDGGYSRPELWLSDGWAALQAGRWSAPLYWEEHDGVWHEFTLRGLVPLDPSAPVAHVSFYEADAFARWAGARLPTEAEWEVAAASQPVAGNFVESGRLTPAPAPRGLDSAPAQLFGDVWEWTASPYVGYPRYRPAKGAIGEYNGKFMCNQLVLRGGSCLTPRSHMRATYRNFFPPSARWQMSGLRLARWLES